MPLDAKFRKLGGEGFLDLIAVPMLEYISRSDAEQHKNLWDTLIGNKYQKDGKIQWSDIKRQLRAGLRAWAGR